MCNLLNIRVITKLTNSEQSYGTFGFFSVSHIYGKLCLDQKNVKSIDHLTQQFSSRNSGPIRRKGARFSQIFTKSVNIKSAVMVLFVQDDVSDRLLV
jgi:hypothetical protein